MKKFLPRTSKNSQGFTLIELMVVVTIIAFLAVIGVVSFTNIQAQSRDGRRRADIDAIATALESNRDPVAGTYSVFVYSPAANTLFANGKVPVDPVDTASTYTAISYNGASYSYTFTSTTTGYVVCARLEKGGGNSSSGTSMDTTGTLSFYCRKSQQ